MTLKIPPVRIYFPEEDRKLILQQIDEALTTGQLTLGKHGKAFEEAFAQSVGVKHAIAVNSGTSSIEIPMRIWDVRDKTVLIPTNTFFATAAAVISAGGKPRFMDADPATFSVSLAEIKNRLTSDTVGVVVVHIAGIVTPEMPAIRDFCQEQGLFLFEDAAHAHGSSLHGTPAGAFGQAASFSFYPTKVITSAEGGMIVTDDPKIHEEALVYRDQGKAGFLSNYHVRLGYNWRMSEPHAIIGYAQFKRLSEFMEARNEIAQVYDAALAAVPGISLLPMPTGCHSNYYKYIALLEPGIDRKAFKKLMREQYGVALSGEVYEDPLHIQPVFQEYSSGEFPLAEDICRRHICLPIFVTMTTAEAQYVVESLTQALQTMKKG